MDVAFRPLVEADFATLASWLAAAHVQQWWDPRHELAFVHEKYGPRAAGADPMLVLVAEVDGEPVGIVQHCPGDQYAWWPSEHGLDDCAVVDGLIGDASMTGRGVGAAILGRFVEHIFTTVADVTGIAASPEAANIASCRVLEKAGFTCVYEGDLPGDGQTSRRIYLLRRPGFASA